MRKILIAEDDYYLRDVYRIAFSKRTDYETKFAIDGADAIEKIKSEPFDIILLDIMMPKVTGIDVLKTLRALNAPTSATPVYIISNLGQQDVLDEVFKIGVQGYIVKSEVIPNQLIELVDKYFIANEQQPAQ